jgi:hypothetical protein
MPEAYEAHLVPAPEVPIPDSVATLYQPERRQAAYDVVP